MRLTPSKLRNDYVKAVFAGAVVFASCLGYWHTPIYVGKTLLSSHLYAGLFVIATLELIQSTQSQRLEKLFDITLFVISFAFAN